MGVERDRVRELDAAQRRPVRARSGPRTRRTPHRRGARRHARGRAPRAPAAGRPRPCWSSRVRAHEEREAAARRRPRPSPPRRRRGGPEPLVRRQDADLVRAEAEVARRTGERGVRLVARVRDDPRRHRPDERLAGAGDRRQVGRRPARHEDARGRRPGSRSSRGTSRGPSARAGSGRPPRAMPLRRCWSPRRSGRRAPRATCRRPGCSRRTGDGRSGRRTGGRRGRGARAARRSRAARRAGARRSSRPSRSRVAVRSTGPSARPAIRATSMSTAA